MQWLCHLPSTTHPISHYNFVRMCCTATLGAANELRSKQTTNMQDTPLPHELIPCKLLWPNAACHHNIVPRSRFARVLAGRERRKGAPHMTTLQLLNIKIVTSCAHHCISETRRAQKVRLGPVTCDASNCEFCKQRKK